MIDNEECVEAMPAPEKAYRPRIYLGFTIQRAFMVATIGSALFGVVLGDIWLWRLLYG